MSDIQDYRQKHGADYPDNYRALPPPHSRSLTARLDTLTASQRDDLGEALLDFQTPADLQQWLDQH